MNKEKLVSLVTGAQQGDDQALDTLFTEFYNDVYYFALKTVKDSDTACDITQETFLEIIRTIGNLKEPAAFVTWMKQITYHQCTRYFSKKKDELVDEDEDGNTIFDTLADESEGSIPAEVLEKEEFRKTILDMIDQLTEEQRSAVMMYYFDELTVSQIAQIQGVSEGTVKSRLNYARKAMRKSVEDYEKKTGIKLHSFAFLPLFLLFFGKEFMAEAKAAEIHATVTASAKATMAGTAGSTSAGAVTKAAANGARVAAKALATKVVAGVAAAALVVTGAVFAIRQENTAPVQETLETTVVCGTAQQPHQDADVDGFCDLCNAATPSVENVPIQESSVLALLNVCEREKDSFVGIIGNTDYYLTTEGCAFNILDRNKEAAVTGDGAVEWFGAGAYPAYYDAEGKTHVFGIWRTFECTGYNGKIVCASPSSFGPVDDYLLEEMWVYTCDENGQLYWNRYVTQVKQEHFIGEVKTYHNRPTGLLEEATGKVMKRVEAVEAIRTSGGNVIFTRYVADGMVYETDEWHWELVSGRDTIPVKNTGILAENVLTDLHNDELICKDPETNTVVIQDQHIPMPQGKTVEQIKKAWFGFHISAMELDDGAIYLCNLNGDCVWEYCEELTLLKQEGKLVEIIAPQSYGTALAKLDDGLLYTINMG